MTKSLDGPEAWGLGGLGMDPRDRDPAGPGLANHPPTITNTFRGLFWSRFRKLPARHGDKWRDIGSPAWLRSQWTGREENLAAGIDEADSSAHLSLALPRGLEGFPVRKPLGSLLRPSPGARTRREIERARPSHVSDRFTVSCSASADGSGTRDAWSSVARSPTAGASPMTMPNQRSRSLTTRNIFSSWVPPR